jgi:hypothetical protein
VTGSCVLRETILKGRPRLVHRTAARLSIYLSIYRSAAAACPSGERATHSAACSAAAKLPRWTSLPPRFTRA